VNQFGDLLIDGCIARVRDLKFPDRSVAAQEIPEYSLQAVDSASESYLLPELPELPFAPAPPPVPDFVF
jgi:hypothetical protein